MEVQRLTAINKESLYAKEFVLRSFNKLRKEIKKN